MNIQYSRVGRIYPKIRSTVLDTKGTRDQKTFSITEENKRIETSANSKVR
ncbi:hypothetical protein [Flavobacterium ovatum]